MGWKKELKGWMPSFYRGEGDWPNFEYVYDTDTTHIAGVFMTQVAAARMCNPKLGSRPIRVTVIIEEDEPVNYMKRVMRKLQHGSKKRS